jgi:hypothetical protein
MEAEFDSPTKSDMAWERLIEGTAVIHHYAWETIPGGRQC